MSGDFYRTGMGHKFYEGTMPELVRQLRRLNDNLEALRATLTKAEGSQHDTDPDESHPA
jgi:hypothetical protein